MSAETTDLTAPLLDLLAVIRDALDIPQPAADEDRASFDWLQRDRVRAALSVIDVVLGDEAACVGCVEAGVGVLRERIRQLPVIYRPFEPEAREVPR